MQLRRLQQHHLLGGFRFTLFISCAFLGKSWCDARYVLHVCVMLSSSHALAFLVDVGTPFI